MFRSVKACICLLCLLAPGSLFLFRCFVLHLTIHPSQILILHCSTPRFVCQEQIGGKKGIAAAYLTPVPRGSVLYGRGESAVAITKVSRLLFFTVHLNVGGQFVAADTTGADKVAHIDCHWRSLVTAGAHLCLQCML